MPTTKTVATLLSAGALTAGGSLLALGGAAAQAKPHPHKHSGQGPMGMKHHKKWMKDGHHHPGGPWMGGPWKMYRHNLVLNSALAPSTTTDPTLHGVTPGTNPWVLTNGHVVVTTTHLHLRVHGLLIPGMGTGAVKTVDASLYCGADSSSTPVATTAQVPLSSTGNATITDAQLTLPSGGCVAPIVLVHPNGNPAAYIAVDGQG